MAVDVVTQIEIARPREQVAAFAAPLLSRAMRRANGSDLRRLKALLEG